MKDTLLLKKLSCYFSKSLLEIRKRKKIISVYFPKEFNVGLIYGLNL